MCNENSNKNTRTHNILNINNEPHFSTRMQIHNGDDFTQVKQVQSTAKEYLRILLYWTIIPFLGVFLS